MGMTVDALGWGVLDLDGVDDGGLAAVPGAAPDAEPEGVPEATGVPEAGLVDAASPDMAVGEGESWPLVGVVERDAALRGGKKLCRGGAQ